MKWILFLMLYSFTCFSQEFSNSFIVTRYDKRIRVISPQKYQANVSILMKNEASDKVVAQVWEGEKTIARLSLKSNESKTIQVKWKKGRRLLFVSIAPPFQAVELKISKEAYEVP